MELPLVQILVVVANIQLRIFRDISLKAEVGKGFVSTAIGHESLGTKANVGPHLWNGVIAASASCRSLAHLVGRK